MFEDYKITLASASPRRRELLAGLDLDFTVETGKDEKEAYSHDIPPFKIPEFLARHKSESFHRPLEEKEILITADTLVFLGSEAIGKPADCDDAMRIIQSLSGKTHSVITGVALRTASEIRSFSDRTDVVLRNMSESEIRYYIDTYRPFDKAGAYGIQEWIGYAAISAIHGSFYNVMGLPVHKVYEALCSITSC